MLQSPLEFSLFSILGDCAGPFCPHEHRFGTFASKRGLNLLIIVIKGLKDTVNFPV